MPWAAHRVIRVLQNKRSRHLENWGLNLRTGHTIPEAEQKYSVSRLKRKRKNLVSQSP